MAISNEERAFFIAFGERLAALRKTQVQLAERPGISRQAVTAHECGRRRMPISMLRALADTFGVNIEDSSARRSSTAPVSAGRRRSCSSSSSASASWLRHANA